MSSFGCLLESHRTGKQASKYSIPAQWNKNYFTIEVLSFGFTLESHGRFKNMFYCFCFYLWGWETGRKASNALWLWLCWDWKPGIRNSIQISNMRLELPSTVCISRSWGWESTSGTQIWDVVFHQLGQTLAPWGAFKAIRPPHKSMRLESMDMEPGMSIKNPRWIQGVIKVEKLAGAAAH